MFNNLKTIRKERKITQNEISKYLNIDQTTYSGYETGKSEPNIDTLKKLAKYFNVTLDELCDYTIEQSKSENIKLFSNIKNDCYNLLVSLTDDQSKLVYAYMLGLTNQQFNI